MRSVNTRNRSLILKTLTGHAEKAETLMLALRKREGISLEGYQNRFGEKIEVTFGKFSTNGEIYTC